MMVYGYRGMREEVADIFNLTVNAQILIVKPRSNSAIKDVSHVAFHASVLLNICAGDATKLRVAECVIGATE